MNVSVVTELKVSYREEIELQEMEELLNAPHCEATHLDLPPDDPAHTCSHTVVAVKTIDCEPSFKMNVCLNCVRGWQYDVGRKDLTVRCQGCERPVAVCWRYTPV